MDGNLEQHIVMFGVVYENETGSSVVDIAHILSIPTFPSHCRNRGLKIVLVGRFQAIYA